MKTIADRYRVTGRLGAGGGGTVWLATDETLGRVVAVKEVELPPHLSEERRDRLRTRALREARSAARLEHRSVVSIFDVIEGDEALFIVMEHIDAPSLSVLLTRDGPLPPARVAAIGLDVLGALTAAHRVGVVHRDVKPSNVLVPDTGHAVVTDFGIAAVLGETGITRTGEALGTPDYIAPEQLGEGPVGPEADLWALGALLYHAVEGVPPFRRPRTMATLNAVATAEPRPPERAGPLERPLLSLLQKDPAARPRPDVLRQRLRDVRDRAGPASSSEPATTAVLPAAAAADPPRDAPADIADRTERIEASTARDDTHPHGLVASEGRGSRRRAAVVLGGIVTVAVVVAGITLGAGDDPVTSPESGEQVAAQAEGRADDGPQDTEQASEQPANETAPSPTPEAAPVVADTAVPDGWRLAEDEDWVVAVPDDWSPRDAPGSAVDLRDPSTGAYLRIADGDEPAADVLADTRRIRDNFQARYPDYEEIALEPVEYRDYDAVRWEYRYTPEGRELRAIHLNFSTGEHGYVLNYQGPSADWDEVADRFETFTATFEPR